MQLTDISIPLKRKNGVPLYTQIRDGLRKMLLSRPPGVRSILPPQRDLADKLGVSRNTVGMAYAELEREGLVASRVGKGTVAVAASGSMGVRTQAEQLERTVEHSLEEALALGFTMEDYEGTVGRVLRDKRKMLRNTRIVFVECNREQLAYFSEHLFLSDDVGVVPVLLRDIRAGRREARARLQAADLIATSFYHLKELEQHLGGKGQRIIGIGLRAEMSTIVGIARIPPGSRIGVVANSREFLAEVGTTLKTMDVAASRIRRTIETDEDALRRFIQSVDGLIVSPSRCKSIVKIAGRKPVVEFQFAPDEASINNLGVALLELKRRRGNPKGG